MKKILIEKYNKSFLIEKLFINRYNSLDKRKCIKYNINFYSIFIFIYIYYLYYLSLEKCLKGFIKCSFKTKWIQQKLNEGLLCSVLLLILIELMIHNIISKLHLIHVILFLISFLIYSHNIEFHDHGLFNFLGIILILISGIIFFLPFKGLNNTYIINDINRYGCRIRIPKYCPYKFMKYFLDMTKRTGFKCGNIINNKKKMLKFSKSKYISISTKKFGISKTNANSIWSKKSNQNKSIFSILRENIFDMENKNLLEVIEKDKIPEVIIDFSENIRGKMNINLEFNKTLSLSRKKIEKEYKPYSNNIMVLYFDSISRATGMRQLKKTLGFFERFMSYKSKDFHSFQFLRYHAFRHHTVGNYPKLFFESNRKKRKKLRITYYLKKYGYITAFSNDMCYNNPYPNKLRDFSKEELSDHEFLLCDPNKRHISSMFKRCLYEKTNIDYQYEYGLQFWKKYKDNRKFLMIVSNDGHEGTLEVIKYADDTVYNFLNSLYKENLLRETTIILLSDHGCPMPSFYYFNDFFRFEIHLPMLFILTSIKEDQNYTHQYFNIYENQQKFITAYDIYNTLCYLMLGNNYFINNKKTDYIFKSKYGSSLFEPINQKSSPKFYSNMEKSICF